MNLRTSIYVLSLISIFSMTNVLAKGKKVSPTHVTGAETINTIKAKQLFDRGAKFLDVRSFRDWEAGRIPASSHIELKKDLNEESLSAIANKDEEIVIYCNSIGCLRSSKACKKAVSWGYSKIYYYRLGFPDWKSNGYAVE